jgi:hypothetical protein
MLPLAIIDSVPLASAVFVIGGAVGVHGDRGRGRAGSNGSIRVHNSSGTIHGGSSPRLTPRTNNPPQPGNAPSEAITPLR